MFSGGCLVFIFLINIFRVVAQQEQFYLKLIMKIPHHFQKQVLNFNLK